MMLTLLVLDFALDIVDGVRALHLKGDGLASQGLYKNLHGGCAARCLQSKIRGVLSVLSAAQLTSPQSPHRFLQGRPLQCTRRAFPACKVPQELQEADQGSRSFQSSNPWSPAPRQCSPKQDGKSHWCRR